MIYEIHVAGNTEKNEAAAPISSVINAMVSEAEDNCTCPSPA